MPEPEYGTDGLFVWITFRRPIATQQESDKTDGENGVVDTTPKTTPKTTSKTTRMILELIKQNASITRKEMAERCGISINGIKWQIRQLQEYNIIRRIGPNKGGHWEIINDEK